MGTSCYKRPTKESLFLALKRLIRPQYIGPDPHFTLALPWQGDNKSCGKWSFVSKGSIKTEFALEVNGTGYTTSRSCGFEFPNSVVSSLWDRYLSITCPWTSNFRGLLWRPCEIMYTRSLLSSGPTFRFSREGLQGSAEGNVKMANKGNSAGWHSPTATPDLPTSLYPKERTTHSTAVWANLSRCSYATTRLQAAQWENQVIWLPCPGKQYLCFPEWVQMVRTWGLVASLSTRMENAQISLPLRL